MKRLILILLLIPIFSFGLSLFSMQLGYNTSNPDQSGFSRMSFETMQPTIPGDIRVRINADFPFSALQPSGSYSLTSHFDILSWLQIHPLLIPVLTVQTVTEDASLSPSLNLGGGVLFRNDDESGLNYLSLDATFLYNNPSTNGFSADLFSQFNFDIAKILLFEWRLSSHLSMYNVNLQWVSDTDILYDLGSIQKANPMNLDLSDDTTFVGIGGDFSISSLSSVLTYNGGGRLLLAWQF